MEIERTISHSWSSDSQQPEPFVKLSFGGCVKETKAKFPRQRYDVVSEKFTWFQPNPPPPFTEIFRNIWASLFRSNPENVRRLSDQKDSKSQDGGKARSTAADPNPKDPEDRDRVYSDENHKAQNSSHQTVMRMVVQDCLIKVTKRKILLKTAKGIVVHGLKHGNTILTLK